MKKAGTRIVALLIVFIISISCLGAYQEKTAYAANKYITRKQAITLILKELNVTYDTSDSTAYLAAAKSVGLINDKTFKNYGCNATKTDLAILLVRADEYLYGVTLSNSIVDEVIEKRISDISSIKSAYQPYLAKAYALGYIKGRSNGSYSTNRKLSPKAKVTIAYAKQLIAMINNKEARHQISPDRQVVRTKNLPEFAEFYPYILESYPNDYYDWEFSFMKYQNSDGPLYGTENFKNLIRYAAPCDFFKYKYGEPVFYTYETKNRSKQTSEEVYNLCAQKWEENARRYIELIFNFDYRNDTKQWKESVMSCDCNYLYESSGIEELVDEFITNATNNKTVVESRLIGVDKSSVYVGVDGIYIRAYVSFRVVSSLNIERVGKSPILFTRESYINLLNLKLNEWRNCYFDISLDTSRENCGIGSAIINDYYHDHRVVMK